MSGKPSVRLLVLLTDAFGGRGGIAKFNRDLLQALCSFSSMTKVTALPRTVVDTIEPLPLRLDYVAHAARGKAAYLYNFVRLLSQDSDVCAVVCAHINLLPLGAIAARRHRVPLILIMHGIEVWRRPHIPMLNASLRGVNTFVSVSRLTKDRFLQWAPLRPDQGYVIPDCVDMKRYGAGPKPEYLIERYGISNRRVIMTLGRLDSRERYKGIDEVLEVLPSLVSEIPEIVYLILGDGDDRDRLQAKVKDLRLESQVIFAGYIREAEKADHYRLADAFVMPGRGEGFGIVYLEAMACGIPVVASKADASREAVLDGRLGVLADPDNAGEVRGAIKEALSRPRAVQKDLQYFSFEKFVERWHELVPVCLGE